jgi:energy-coupling factor transport system substrate-specific component
VIALLAALALAVTPAQYLHAHQAENGGFSEPSGTSTPGLTAWALLGLASHGQTDQRALSYLRAQEHTLREATDLELALAAEAASGAPSEALLARVLALRRPNGAIGPTLNSTYWGVIALRQAGIVLGADTRRYILAAQARSGGWAWSSGSAPDSNDTAAAIQALRTLGVSGPPIRRGLAYLRALQNRDGGFELTEGRGSDAQSTAWAIQAFLAARQSPGKASYAYLARLRRPDGSFRYSAKYAVTPVWVTAQVMPALARRSFPLR